MSETATQGREAERYPQIVRVIRETPWAIMPGTLATIIDIVGRRLDGERLTDAEIEARVGGRDSKRDTQVAGSVGILPIYGVIIPKATLFSEMSGGTSVQSLQADFRELLGDETVKSIVLDIDSPGGMTDGLPELAAEFRAARGQKPIVAVANYRAGSAAYWLGAQADEFVAPPSADVGSIGVFAAHEDVSALQENLGVKTTLISAGKYKVEGNPFEPLDDEARAAIQDRVDEMYGMFTSDVAKGRGVTTGAVKEGYGEGRMLSAANALREGMIDRVDTLEGVVKRLQNPAGRARISNGATASSGTSAVTVTSTLVELGRGLQSGPLAPHKTATSDAPWDGPAAKANLRNDGGEAYYRSAFAWQDDSADANTKAAYKFIHHEVSSDGDVGAANLTACSQGIVVLNGGRTGTTIPDADRKGVWNHLAKHLRDAGREPPPLKGLSEPEAADSGLTFADEAHALRDGAGALIERLSSLAEVERGSLTRAKRESLSACPEALREAAQQIDDVLALTDPDQEGLDSMAELELQFLDL